MRYLLLCLFLSSGSFAKSFTDEDLKYLMKVLPSGIIYVWSPHMPYSMKGIATIKAVGDRLLMPVFVILDPHANEKAARHAQAILQLSDTELRRMNSKELWKRNINVQFPSAVVFSKGRLRGGTVPGIKSQDRYIKILLDQLQR